MEISERKKYVRIGHSVPLRDKIIYFSASFETPFLADGVSSRFFLFSVSGASECQKHWWGKACYVPGGYNLPAPPNIGLG